MSERLTLKNAVIFDPSQGLQESGSVVVEGGKIIEVLKGKNADSGQIFDVQGQHLVPGFIDLRCQLGEGIKSATAAAAAGGFTTICGMPHTQPVNDSGFVTQHILEQVRQSALVKVHPIGAISQGLQGTAMAAIDSMLKAGCVGLSDGNKSVMNAYLLRKTMEYVKPFDIPIIEHCEDQNLVGLGVMNEGLISSQIGLRGIPNAAEDVIVSRDISLSAHTGGRLHLSHLSSKGSIESLAHGKARGLPLSADVSVHHLLLTEEALGDYNTAFKLTPPLRTALDRKNLVDALRSGLIDCLVSDHSAQSEEDKDVEFENATAGASAFETTFAAAYELVRRSELNLQRLVESLTSAPAKIFKLKDRGQIKVGMAADFAVIDTKLSWQIDSAKFLSKSRYTPLQGTSVHAKVTATFVGGRQVFDHKKGIVL